MMKKILVENESIPARIRFAFENASTWYQRMYFTRRNINSLKFELTKLPDCKEKFGCQFWIQKISKSDENQPFVSQCKYLFADYIWLYICFYVLSGSSEFISSWIR